jgi:hypothetical protein
MAVPDRSQAYDYPPTKLALQPENQADVTGLVAKNSPREIPGVDTSSPRVSSWWQEEWDTSIAQDLPSSAELHAELQAMEETTGAFSWRLLPAFAGDAIPALGAGWMGWEIGSGIWGFFNPGPPPPQDGVDYRSGNYFYPVGPGDLLLDASTAGQIRAPTWGVVVSHDGDPTEGESRGNCEGANSATYIDGPGGDLWLPWQSAFPWWCPDPPVEYRNGVRFLPTTFGPTDQVEYPVDGNAGQGPEPSAEEFTQRLGDALATDQYPILNEWLNHQIDPDNYADPTDTTSQVRTVLDSPGTHKEETTDQILNECGTALFHFTSSANAELIYNEPLVESSEPDPPYPSGFFASTLTPVASGWTQEKLSLHLFQTSQKPSSAWDMFCTSLDPSFRNPVPGAKPGPPSPLRPDQSGESDYWYIPAPGGADIPVHPIAWGPTLVPAN